MVVNKDDLYSLIERLQETDKKTANSRTNRTWFERFARHSSNWRH
ncbi:MAG: hypothetical protein K0R57_2605 [Paenibacillaceae bacterium]|nr:hypothetical protein [Paenibacillaceae bacterium]